MLTATFLETMFVIIMLVGNTQIINLLQSFAPGITKRFFFQITLSESDVRKEYEALATLLYVCVGRISDQLLTFLLFDFCFFYRETFRLDTRIKLFTVFVIIHAIIHADHKHVHSNLYRTGLIVFNIIIHHLN